MAGQRELVCQVCGVTFVGVSARTCGETCKKRLQRGRGGASVVPIGTAPDADEPRGTATGVSVVLERELAAVGRLETVAGQAALVLARRLDSGRDLGSAQAALARELFAARDRALADTKKPDSALGGMRDALADRRAARGAAV